MLSQLLSDLFSYPFPQPLIRERAVSALRACLRLTAQRETKEAVNTRCYQVGRWEGGTMGGWEG